MITSNGVRKSVTCGCSMAVKLLVLNTFYNAHTSQEAKAQPGNGHVLGTRLNETLTKRSTNDRTNKVLCLFL